MDAGMNIELLIACILSIALHEAGHVCAALSLGLGIKRIGLNWRGPYIVRERGSPWQNVFTAFAGPLVNLLLACFGPHEWRLINLVLGLTNLIPYGPTDGAGIWIGLREHYRRVSSL